MAAINTNYGLLKNRIFIEFSCIGFNNLKCFESVKSDFVVCNINFAAHFFASWTAARGGSTAPTP
jgi:hypothetical protein